MVILSSTKLAFNSINKFLMINIEDYVWVSDITEVVEDKGDLRIY